MNQFRDRQMFMPKSCRIYLLSLAVMLAALHPVAVIAADPMAISPARFEEVPATPEIIKQIRAGGYVLYLRHGTTDNTRPDRYPAVDLNDCNTQRPLTDEGRKLAAYVGDSIRKARIPVGKIRISPLCRVKETAAIAFPGQATSIEHELMYTANLTSEQKAPILAKTRHLLSMVGDPGKNNLIIAHAPNLMDLIGYFPKEGTLVVFLPKGEAGFVYVASISPAQWSDLLR